MIPGIRRPTVVEGEGITLTPTADAFEPIGGGFGGGEATPSEPKDLILVPVNGDWTGVLQVEYDPNDVTFAMSSYFSFLAMAGDDYQDMVGIRGTKLVDYDIQEALQMKKPFDDDLYEMNRQISI